MHQGSVVAGTGQDRSWLSPEDLDTMTVTKLCWLLPKSAALPSAATEPKHAHL